MLQDEIMKLQTYKMFEGEDTVYVERDDVLKALKQQPCEDAISRQAVLDYLDKMPSELTSDGRRMVRRRTLEEYISDTLPSVTPQSKMGKWLAKSFHEVYCDNCGFDFDIMTNEFMDKMKYCPNCGAKMESEE